MILPTSVGIKVHGDRVFLNVPRWHGNDHPVNLATVPRPGGGSGCIRRPSAPRLKPFPNLEFQVAINRILVD